jgi:hypothetical protein
LLVVQSGLEFSNQVLYAMLSNRVWNAKREIVKLNI